MMDPDLTSKVLSTSHFREKSTGGAQKGCYQKWRSVSRDRAELACLRICSLARAALSYLRSCKDNTEGFYTAD
jgi:hypothetical protein